MVSDEELQRHVKRTERGSGHARETGPRAREIHNELARRIEQTRAEAADAENLQAVMEQLDAIESRLSELESRLD